MIKINTTFANFSNMALSRNEMRLIMGGVGEEPGTEFGTCNNSCSRGDIVAGCKVVSTKLGNFCTCKIVGGVGC